MKMPQVLRIALLVCLGFVACGEAWNLGTAIAGCYARGEPIWPVALLLVAIGVTVGLFSGYMLIRSLELTVQLDD